MMDKIILSIFVWNVFVFLLYGIDKWKAIKSKWRISERTLILSAFIMGSIGAILGMSVFRHKTKHIKFRILLPLALVFNIAVIFLFFSYYKVT